MKEEKTNNTEANKGDSTNNDIRRRNQVRGKKWAENSQEKCEGSDKTTKIR